MTKLLNEIVINAPRDKVWGILSNIEMLEQYDPITVSSKAVSELKSGIGASRKCDVQPNGWFKEQVTEWENERAITFQLYECTLPVKNLKHSYILEDLGGKTRVVQTMEYKLKYGVIGNLMDTFMVRKKWDDGIKLFFKGLKDYAEKQGA